MSSTFLTAENARNPIRYSMFHKRAGRIFLTCSEQNQFNEFSEQNQFNEFDAFLLTVADWNILLAIHCLEKACFEEQPNLKTLLQQLVKQQFHSEQVELFENAVRALYELGDFEYLAHIFATVGRATPLYRQLVQSLLNQGDETTRFDFFRLVFTGCKTRIEQRQGVKFKEFPSHTLWLWAIESFSVQMELKTEEQDFILEIYQFFLQQTDYSETLDLLYTKFSELSEEFDAKLAGSLEARTDYSWARRVYEELIKHDPRNIRHYTSKMKSLGIRLDETSYSTLINKSENFATARAYFEEMKQRGLTPNEISYNTLIHKSDNFATAQAYFEEMKQLGLKPNEISYNTLINHSDNFATAQAYFEEMKQLGLTPDEISYNTLIHKSENFATAQAYFEEMKQLGLKPNEISYNTLLRKAQRAPFIEILKLLEAMQAAGLKPQSKFDKRQKRYRNYTLEAVQPTIKKNRKLFTDWAKKHGSQEQVWQDFYADCLKMV